MGRRKRERNGAELSQDRKLLIRRYMDDWLEGAGRGPDADPEPEEKPEVEAALHLAVAQAPDAAPPRPQLVAVESTQGAYEESPRPRRGRPPGARKRRQVHFHVDADEDQLLLRAADRFGSQQKALIEALHALDEVLDLRDRVNLLQSENSKQRRLITQAQEFFRSS